MGNHSLGVSKWVPSMSVSCDHFLPFRTGAGGFSAHCAWVFILLSVRTLVGAASSDSWLVDKLIITKSFQELFNAKNFAVIQRENNSAQA